MKKLWLAAAAIAMVPTLAAAQKLDLSKPDDALWAARKMQCSLKDGEPVVYHWSGRVWSRVPGEPDRNIFNVEGFNVRACVTVNDPQKGRGYRMVSRELMLYLDPKTGQVLRTWNNPWTGKTVDVIHVANDPVNARAPSFPKNDRGEPYKFPGRVEHGRIFQSIEVPLFYTNPLAGEYQDYVGNQYHAMEIFDFNVEEADLLNAKKNTARPAIAWVRLAQWLPWMQMNSRAGSMVFNATGQVVPSFDALPAVLKDEVAKNYPIYNAPPPLDDTRPNETSWTYFKKVIDAKPKTKAAPAH